MTVVLLTQNGCELCDRAHGILERLAHEYPIEVTVVDLASDEGQALAERGGILFPPGLFLDGEPFSYGRVSERRLRRELDRRVRTRRADA